MDVRLRRFLLGSLLLLACAGISKAVISLPQAQEFSAFRTSPVSGARRPLGLPDAALMARARSSAQLAFQTGDARMDAFTQDVIAELSRCPTGRMLLTDILDEAALRGVRIQVKPMEVDGTFIKEEDGVEFLETSQPGKEDFSEWTYSYNAGFSRMSDPELALQSAAAAAAHGLQHMLYYLRASRELKGWEAVLYQDQGTEQSATLCSALVAMELFRPAGPAYPRGVPHPMSVGARPGHPTMMVLEARKLMADPESYWPQVKVWLPAFALGSTAQERRDPIRAYEKRLRILEEHRAKLRRTQPAALSDLDQALAQVRGRLASMRAAQARPFFHPFGSRRLSRLRQAVQDPVFQSFHQEMIAEPLEHLLSFRGR
ncbi:MAG: hypothetical protein WCU88_06350 [Elusimicrobiota bacterium]|jgi:hypothetical protein